MAKVRLLLIDDCPEFLNSAEALLSRDHRIEIVGCATSSPAGIDLVRSATPELVLLDINMPGIEGFSVAQLIKIRTPAPLVILMSIYDEEEYRFSAASSGADEFIAKTDFVASFPRIFANLFAHRPLSLIQQCREREGAKPFFI